MAVVNLDDLLKNPPSYNYAQALQKALELCGEYDTYDGVIRTPGKFEGETILAPYVYGMVQDGIADEIEARFDPVDASDELTEGYYESTPEPTFEVELTDFEMDVFRAEGQWAYLFEDSQGFVTVTTHSVRLVRLVEFNDDGTYDTYLTEHPDQDPELI